MKDSSFFKTQTFPDHASALQLEIEQITQNLEFEKRESGYLEEQIKLLQYELSTLPKPSKSSINSLKAQVSVMERNLGLEIATLNKTKHSNTQLRGQINEYRLDKSAHKQSLNAICDSLNKTSKETDDRVKENLKTAEVDESQQERIFRIRAKSANQRSVYEEKINTLNSMLREPDTTQRMQVDDKSYAAQSIEVIRILKTMSKFAQKHSVDKKRNLDQYLKHVQALSAGFGSIRSASGINVVEDIVTSTVKSEEQSRQVLHYLNSLNAEIDLLQEKQKNYAMKIKTLEGSKNKGEVSLQEFHEAHYQYLKKIQENCEEKSEKLQKIVKELRDTLPMIKKMYVKVQNCDFKGLKIEELDLEAIEKLNQETASQLLGNIEDFALNFTFISKMRLNRSVPALKKKVKTVRPIIEELLDEKDLYNEPGFDEIKVPISVEQMKGKALMLYQSRRSFLKSKPNTPDVTMSRTPKGIVVKEPKVKL